MEIHVAERTAILPFSPSTRTSGTVANHEPSVDKVAAAGEERERQTTQDAPATTLPGWRQGAMRE